MPCRSAQPWAPQPAAAGLLGCGRGAPCQSRQVQSSVSSAGAPGRAPRSRSLSPQRRGLVLVWLLVSLAGPLAALCSVNAASQSPVWGSRTVRRPGTARCLGFNGLCESGPFRKLGRPAGWGQEESWRPGRTELCAVTPGRGQGWGLHGALGEPPPPRPGSEAPVVPAFPLVASRFFLRFS